MLNFRRKERKGSWSKLRRQDLRRQRDRFRKRVCSVLEQDVVHTRMTLTFWQIYPKRIPAGRLLILDQDGRRKNAREIDDDKKKCTRVGKWIFTWCRHFLERHPTGSSGRVEVVYRFPRLMHVYLGSYLLPCIPRTKHKYSITNDP